MKYLNIKIIQVLCLLLITSTMSLQAESVLKNNNARNDIMDRWGNLAK